MRGRLIAACAAGMFYTLIAAPAAGAVPASSGCRAFGINVAGLAQDLGADFGATASGVARRFPAAFPTLVVVPEQQALCS